MKEFRKEHLREAINKQMDINWYKKRYEDLQKIPNWFIKMTTTKEKEEEFSEYLRWHLKPFVVKQRLEKEVSHFILNYWLKIDDEL